MKCFVIMPFGNPKTEPERARKLELIYSQWIKPAVESVLLPDKLGEKIHCIRGDRDVRTGEVIRHIVDNLVNAEIAVADLSGRNANVFYELGVRHAVNNNSILIADNVEDIPFDLRGLRHFEYRYEPEQMLNLKNWLEQSVAEIVRDPNKIDNPVRQFLYDREVQRIVTAPAPPGYDVVMQILSEMANLRKEVQDRLEEVRHIVSAVTSGRDAGDKAPGYDLKFFEGVWRVRPSGSMIYARIVEGELRMPYCFGGDSLLTGHYFNCRLHGETLFARFEWLGENVSGYGVYKIASRDRLVGGWWYADDVPLELRQDYTQLNTSLPGITHVTLERLPGLSNFPEWVEDYYRKRGAVRSG